MTIKVATGESYKLAEIYPPPPNSFGKASPTGTPPRLPCIHKSAGLRF